MESAQAQNVKSQSAERLGSNRVSGWDTYWRLLGYTRPYLGRLAIGVVCGLIFASTSSGFLTFIYKGFPNFYDPTCSLRHVVFLAAILMLIGAIRGFGDFCSRYFIRWVGSRVVMDLRNAVFRRLNELSLSYFVGNRAGELISRTTNDTLMAEGAVSVVIEDIAREPMTLLISIGCLVWLDPWLALISLALFPICIVPVALFGRRVRQFSRDAQQRIADVVSILQEMIYGVRVVKAFGMEPYEIDRYARQNEAFFRRVMRVARANAAIEPLIVFIATGGVGLMLVYVWQRQMRMHEFFTYAAALFFMYNPVKKLSRIHLQIQQASAAADRIFEVLDAPVEVRNRPDAVDFDGPVTSISFENVRFAYGTEPVLDGIELAVKAGQRIAFVGSSGAGKTTLVNLLPRFYDVTGGAIRINGRDIRDYTLASLRQQMGIVTQDTVLFNDTVANNISYGSSVATRADVIRAARLAHADEFIAAMPQGYDTVIGDQGMRLSGGQRQRLAIARAALRNPPIMILDEATSSLDTESERMVQSALEELMAGRTVFAIAHRLSTITRCDRIIVLAQGRVVEDGSHEELLARGRQYKYFYDLAFQEPMESRDATKAQ